MRSAFTRQIALLRPSAAAAAVAAAATSSSGGNATATTDTGSGVSVALDNEQLLQSSSDAYITSMSRDSDAGTIYYTTQQGGIFMYNESSAGQQCARR